LKARRGFPDGFLWGTATAAFQVEMGRGPVDNRSDWFMWVHDPTNVERGLVSGDLPENGPGFWELYRMDLKLARDALGNNAVRLGLEWSRLFPEPTMSVPARVVRDKEGNISRVDISKDSMEMLHETAERTAVERYREILAEARRLGMTVLLTLYHWPLPLWLHDPIACRDKVQYAERRGWLEPSTIVEFAKYAAFVGDAFGDLVDLYATINEPMVVSGNGYWNASSGFPPGLGDFELFMKASKNLAIAHGVAYEMLKRWDTVSVSKLGPATVGLVHNPQYYEAYDAASKDDVAAARFLEYVWNEWFLNAAIKGDYDMDLDMIVSSDEQHPGLVKGCDYLGVNYYMRNRIKAVPDATHRMLQGRGVPCEGDCTDMGWEIYPPGIRYVVNWAYNGYRRPIMVTENGIADVKDEKRSRYLIAHVEELHSAVDEDRVPLRGYFHWSLVDNYEWAKGFKMRFGLFRVNPETKERTPTEAVRLYKEIASRNALLEGRD